MQHETAQRTTRAVFRLPRRSRSRARARGARARRLLAAAALVAACASCALPSEPGNPYPSDEWFFRLGRCEQPGNGWQGVQWNSFGAYPGGLGFLPATWESVRDPGWAAVMSDAPWQQQVIGARRLYARYGPEPWSCARVIGGAF